MKIYDLGKPSSGNKLYRHIVQGPFDHQEQFLMKNGFYIVLVTNGTATLSASDHTHNIGSRDLVIMTPSMECSVVPSGRDFSLTCIYMRPDYFDALPAGQSIYGQLPRFTARYGVAISHLAAEDYEYLCLTMRLFSDRLQDTDRYGNGARVHLCSFMLLQISDMIHRCSPGTASCYIKRSTELFRNFKKLAVDHYRSHHDIAFYADRLNISTTYLSRIVKATSGHTVRFHLSELLSIEAKRLLENTDMDINKIADTLGFSDQSVFGKFFLRKTGLSPMKFRLKSDLQHL